jgi:hypothetical protein
MARNAGSVSAQYAPTDIWGRDARQQDCTGVLNATLKLRGLFVNGSDGLLWKCGSN